MRVRAAERISNCRGFSFGVCRHVVLVSPHGNYLGREVTCDKPHVREGRFRRCDLQSDSALGDSGCILARGAILCQVGVAVAGAGWGEAGQSPRSPQQLGQAARETRTRLAPIETPVPSCPPQPAAPPGTAARATFQGLKPVPLPPRSRLIALMHPEVPALPPSHQRLIIYSQG